MESMSRMPKSCRIWLTGLPVRPCSAITSSYCKSSTLPCSLINSNNGLDCSAIISALGWFVGLARGGHGLGQLQFLQFLLDGDGVLGLRDDLFPGNHARHVLVDQEAVQSHHAVFRAGLDVRVKSECFVVSYERGNEWRVDHDLKN